MLTLNILQLKDGDALEKPLQESVYTWTHVRPRGFHRQALHSQVSVVSYRNCLKSRASVPRFYYRGRTSLFPRSTVGCT